MPECQTDQWDAKPVLLIFSDDNEDQLWDEIEHATALLEDHAHYLRYSLASAEFDQHTEVRHLLARLRDLLDRDVVDDSSPSGVALILPVVDDALCRVDHLVAHAHDSDDWRLEIRSAVAELRHRMDELAGYFDAEAARAARRGEWRRAATLHLLAAASRHVGYALGVAAFRQATEEIPSDFVLGRFEDDRGPPGRLVASQPGAPHGPPDVRQDVPTSTPAAIALAA